MSHKRVSQLVELGTSEVASGDLFYIIDVSAKEGKKIQIDSLVDYLIVSGSLTAVTAITADTASFIFGYNVYGPVTSSLTSFFASSSVSSSWSSQSLSSSFATTASYAENVGTGTSVSSSWASQSLSSSYSTVAALASQSAFLVYSGNNNGTASYAVNTLNVISSSYAKTASYVSGLAVESCSYAKTSSVSNTTVTSSYLDFNGDFNGTASYALTAGGFDLERTLDYGLFLAITQSTSMSMLDNVDISSSLNVPVYTEINVNGTANVIFTSSNLVNESLNLVFKDRNTGIETVLDSTPVFVDISRTLNSWGNLMSGSFSMPYTMVGSASVVGNYMVFVTSSATNVQIDSGRINRFNISSKGDALTVNSDEPLIFSYTSPSTLIEFSSSAGGPFTDTLTGILTTGSTEILGLYFQNAGVINSIKYVWSLPNLTELNCDENPALPILTGMPDTLETLSCNSCSLSAMTSLANTTMSYFSCHYNELIYLPDLPASLSYLDCSSNNLISLPTLPNTMSYLNAGFNSLTSIPSSFPYGLTELYLNNNSLTSTSTILPVSLLTMSFSNNNISILDINIPNTSSAFPPSLEHLDVSYTQISSLLDLPSTLLYFNATSCSLTILDMDSIFSQSLSYGLSNGYVYVRGNGPVMVSTVNDYILPLQGNGWTIEYDGVI